MKKPVLTVILAVVLGLSVVAGAAGYTLSAEYLAMIEEVFPPTTPPVETPFGVVEYSPVISWDLWLELDDYFYADNPDLFDYLAAVGRFDVGNRYRILLAGVRGYRMAVGQFDYDFAYVIDLHTGELTHQFLLGSREETPDTFQDRLGTWWDGSRVSERRGIIRPDGSGLVARSLHRFVQVEVDEEEWSWAPLESHDLGTNPFALTEQGRLE